uniref:Thyroglobulin type-1 domain-containing protein n=1 Tax=Onchocerca volvulus TaxID=6282 RepID=A0A8R1XXV0_ONCVO
MKNCVRLHLFLVIITANSTRTEKFQRICEAQGTCINCGDASFSYYKCSVPNDCFTDEICTKQGFCCPTNKTLSSLSNDELEFLGVPVHRYESGKSGICPDGSAQLRQCSVDSDCLGDEICAIGRCCSVCSQHRRRVLNDLPTNNVVGVHIPQCDPTGKYYRAVQCRTGTEECWCVSQFGGIIGSLKPKTTDSNAACEALRLTLKRITEKKQKVYSDVWERVETRRKQENLTSPKQENQSSIILSKEQTLEPKKQFQSISDGIRDKCLWMKRGRCPDRPILLINASKLCYCDDDCSDSQKCCPVLTGEWACFSNITVDTGQILAVSHSLPLNSTTVKAKCTENEQFIECVDECQPVCFSRTSIPCFNGRCKSGCQCKPGFIRQRNDLHAPCIPRNQCPRRITESERHCIDPLREYKTCGPACPISCSSESEKCRTERCVEGCFCKVPYILENSTDPLRSRCILSIYCPPLARDNSSMNSTIHLTAMASMTPKFHLFPEHYEDSTNQPTTTECSDPLKNFQICGSGCPGGCNNQIAGFCGTQCIAGCFCRNPYILQDAYNLNSQCVLPHQCQSSIINQQQICSDPRKEWTRCFSYECARSCSNPKATCTTDDCTPGCICREPYLLYDSNNPNSRCVLPSECGSQCSDSLKEYQACASSCPMGCNNRVPQTCSPCVSGCFCKSGFVFEDAVNWRTSKCIPLNQCPMTNISAFLVALIPENKKSANITECPATTVDLSGKFCNFDSDCPAQQRCCYSTLYAMASSKQSRCTCLDPHAYWDPCGALCPEYCGQLATPVCSSTCNPGCHCAYGYVKARNHVNAPCVLRTQCFQLEDQKHTTKPYNMWKEIATVKMLSDENKIIGDVKIKEISKERIKLEGTIKGLPIGEHALIIHQAGDLSDSCANIGPIMASDKKFNVSAIFGNVKADGFKNATIDREIDWPQDISLIGRSLVIHKLSVMEWSLRNEDVLPLACGTIGFASS